MFSNKALVAVAATAVALLAHTSAAQTAGLYELQAFAYPCAYRERQKSRVGADTALSYEYRVNGRYSRVTTYDANFKNQLATQIVRADITDAAGNVAVFTYQAGTCAVEYVPLASTMRQMQPTYFATREETKWDGHNVYKYYNVSTVYTVYADRKDNFVWGVELNTTSATENTTATVTEYKTWGNDLSAYHLDEKDFPLCPDDRIYKTPSKDFVLCAACTVKAAIGLVVSAILVALANLF